MDTDEHFPKGQYACEASLKINLIFEILRNPVIIGILTFASTVAAVLAAYFSWKQLRVQYLRWVTEEARSKPIIYLMCSP
ncbi:MAG: hypothetical protein ACYT04_52725, partial [Nostoc sp.]